jgi:hypothetical protein
MHIFSFFFIFCSPSKYDFVFFSQGCHNHKEYNDDDYDYHNHASYAKGFCHWLEISRLVSTPLSHWLEFIQCCAYWLEIARFALIVLEKARSGLLSSAGNVQV